MGKSRRNTNLKPMMIATCHWRATFYSKEITVVISWVGGFVRFNRKDLTLTMYVPRSDSDDAVTGKL